MEKTEIYKENFTEHLLRLALDVGEGMLRCGAEISRIEDTVERICYAYGAAHVEVFTIISFINVTLRMPDGSYSSQMRRIRTTGTNFSLLEGYNALSRRICANPISLEDFEKEIRAIKKTAGYKAPLIYLGAGLASASFTMLFGGRWNDGLVAFLIGILIGMIDVNMPIKVNTMAKTVVSSALAATVAILFFAMGAVSSSHYVIMGAIMLLVPGVAFGTAMRDLLYGDLLTGTLKTLQAILIALMIAFGYIISVEFIGVFGVPLDTSVEAGASFDVFFKPLFFIASIGALFGSLGFAIIFKVAPRHLAWAAISGLATYIVYYSVEFLTEGAAFAAAFVSTMVTALFAEVFSRTRKAPTIVFLVPGVIPTVPGGFLYRAMCALLLFDFDGALEYLLVTLQIGLGIAGGIMTVSIIFGIVADKLLKGKK